MRLPRLLASTGAALVLLAAAADCRLGSGFLPLFAALAAAAWWLGSRPAARAAGSSPTFLALADALLPLLVLGAERAALSPTALVLLAAGAHQLLASARLARGGSGLDATSPYWIAGSFAVLAALLLGSGALAAEGFVVLVSIPGLLLATLWARARAELAEHLSAAGLGLVVLAAAADVAAFAARPSVHLLVFLSSISLVLLLLALSGGSPPIALARAIAGLASLTLALAGALSLVPAPIAGFALATSSWTAALALLGVVPGREDQPFSRAARLVAPVTGLGVVALVTWAVWPGAASPPLYVPASLLLVALALAAESVFSRRHPAIASTFAGFVARRGALEITSSLAPLLTLAAAGALGRAAAGGRLEGGLFACLALGTVLFRVADVAQAFYPAASLRRAGYAATVLPVAAADHPRTALAALIWVAAVFLWRSFVERKASLHAAFLAAATLSGAVIAWSFAPAPASVGLALLALALTAARGPLRRPEHAERASWTLALALASASSALALHLARAPASPGAPLAVWLGGFVLVGTTATFPLRLGAATLLGRAIEAAALVLFQAAGALGAISLAAALGLSRGWAAPAIALLAIAHLRFARALGERREARLVFWCACGLAALAPVLLLVSPAGRAVSILALLVTAVFCFAAERNARRVLAPLGRFLSAAAAALGFAAGTALAPASAATAALVLAWHARRTRSLASHTIALVLVTAAGAALATLLGRPAGAGLALASLALLALAETLARGEGRGVRARLTALCALGAGGLAAASGLLARGEWPLLAAAWGAFLAAGRAWGAGTRDGDLRPEDPENEWIALLCALLGHVSGGVAVAAASLSASHLSGVAAICLAAWAWAHAVASRRAPPDSATSAALAAAPHLFAFGALLLAAQAQSEGPLGVAAAASVALLYATALDGPFAIPALIEAIWLLGILWRIGAPELYATPPGLYAWRLLAARRRSHLAARVLASAAVALVLLPPLGALFAAGAAWHLVTLGAGALVLVGFLPRDLPGGITVPAIACAALAAGAVRVAIGQPEPWVTLFLAAGGLGVLGATARSALAARARALSPSPLPARAAPAP